MRALLPVVVVVVLLAAGCASELAAPGCEKTKSCKEEPETVEPPRLFVDPPFGLGFDCVTIGCDHERRLVVENRGGGVIKLPLVRLSVDTSHDFVLRRGDDGELPFDDATSVEITPDVPLELFVRYVPSNGVDDEGAVTLDWYDGAVAFDDAVLTRVELPLSTRALGSVSAALQGGRLNFGFVPVGGYSTREIVIKNDGNGGVLTVGPVSLGEGTSTAFEEPGSGAWGPQFVNPGAEARIPVNFRPDVDGAFVGQLIVETNDGARPALQIEVAGTATAEPLAAVSVTALDFQTLRVGSSRTIEFLVENHGGEPLTVQGGVLGLGFSLFPTDEQTIAPLEAVAFAAVWTPTSGGPFNGLLGLFTNDPTQTQILMGATGFADAPALSAAPPSFDFGGVVQGWTTGAGTFLIRNTGFGELTIDTIAFDVGSSSQIRFAEVPPLPLKLGPDDPPVAVSVFLEATTLGTTSAVVLVGSDSVDTGLGSGGVARLNVTARVITCDEGCPTPNGTPSCGTGACAIGSCDNRFHDPDQSVSSGCECGEDFVPGGGNTRRDVSGTCGGHDFGDLGDNCSPHPSQASFTGTLHGDDDVDLFFFRADDDSSFLSCDVGSDSYRVTVRVDDAPNGVRICGRKTEPGGGCGGENQRTCSGTSGTRSLQLADGGAVTDDDNDVTVWVEWAPGQAQEICASYTVVVRAEE